LHIELVVTPPSVRNVTVNPDLSPPRHQKGRLRRFSRALVTHPRDAVEALREDLAKRSDHPGELVVDDSWQEHFHGFLGAAWPCPDDQAVENLWSAAGEELRRRGTAFGRATYGEYSDGDLSLTRAVWCSVLHLRANVVVETGVAHGVTSRIVLEAFNQFSAGHLWSIDQPHLFDPSLHIETGAAVPEQLRSRWTYVEGSSRRRLPAVLRTVGQVDVFVHDSLHTARNTLYEMSQAFQVLAPGGVMIIDDISTHQGFASFVKRTPGTRNIVCRSADGLGLFGILWKSTASPEAEGS
jgi:hypothetical protein